MFETERFKLPLLAGGQAQKHVTANEAFARLDALTHPCARSRSLGAPPQGVQDGDLFLIAHPSAGPWTGHDGDIAMFLNGGWEFLKPFAGMQAWVVDEQSRCMFDGVAWLDATGGSYAGAFTKMAVSTIDHAVVPAATSNVADAIPAKAMVLGVTARVIETLSGPGLMSWRLGAPGASGRYGTGYGISLNAYAEGLTSYPMVYFTPTSLVIEAEGGVFDSGRIRLAVHHLKLEAPRPL